MIEITLPFMAVLWLRFISSAQSVSLCVYCGTQYAQNRFWWCFLWSSGQSSQLRYHLL